MNAEDANSQPKAEPVQPSSVDVGSTAEKVLSGPSEQATVDKTLAAAGPLTPEEQMALYEKELKENDWGHQPC